MRDGMIELTDSSLVLATFYEESLLSAREKLFSIVKKLSGENLVQGFIEQAMFTNENFIEENYKKFYSLKIKLLCLIHNVAC